ncbi:MAG: LpxI family protein [Candidatus Omnitrophica bacterium]|nr:LpxI family protein [Candidatus Omnitrophota bacterium]
MKTETIGIFISDDEFSAYVYKKIKEKGIDVFPVSFTSCRFATTQIFNTGDITHILEYLKEKGVGKLLLIGKVPPDLVFKKMHHSSDIFLKGKLPLSGELILKKLADFLKEKGIDVIPLTKVLKDEIAQERNYTDIPLADVEKKDINIGFNFLQDVMKYRIGQSVVVKKGMVVAVEGMEGTDEMIRRAGRYCKEFVVVKIAGKNKDERFDIPVIGPHTVEVLAEVGGRVIAVEAGRTIIFDYSKTVELCNKNRITLIGIKGDSR